MSKFAINDKRRYAMRQAGMAPFESHWNSNANYTAERTMADRSHFYSEDTLKYFKCRVSHVDIRFDGLLMITVHSQSSDYSGTAREWHYAVHDCSGHALHRNDGGFATRDKAEKEMYAFLATVKPGEVLKEMVSRKRHELNRQRKALSEI